MVGLLASLAGWLAGWLIGWLVGWLAGWPAGRRGCLAGWLVCQLVGHLAGWLAGWRIEARVARAKQRHAMLSAVVVAAVSQLLVEWARGVVCNCSMDECFYRAVLVKETKESCSQANFKRCW